MIVKSVIKSAAVQSKETGGTFDTLLLLFLPQTAIAESQAAPKLGSVAVLASVEESCSSPSYLSCFCSVAGDAAENAREGHGGDGKQ